jgi:outer membrane protein OmpA-like peptidoglycan-associated protein
MDRTSAPLLLAAALLGLAGCATPKPKAYVTTPPRCADQVVQIYFEPQVAEITPEGRAVISAAAAQARGCKVTAVDVTGLADAVGAPDANLELSKKRAQSVAKALAGAGLPTATFSLAAAGEQGAVTAEGKAHPLRRRVDVALRLSPS